MAIHSPVNHWNSRWMCFALLLLAAMMQAVAPAAERHLADSGEASRKPNFIFILADDLGYGDLGCYGQKLIQTPRIDRMAHEGIRFTECYAGSPVCAPSRNVLMTGFHTGHTWIRDNFPQVGGVVESFGEGDRRLSLRAEDLTVAQILKKAGYATGITGKWGLAEPNTDGVPNRKGFEEWFGYLNQNHAAYYYTPYLWKNERRQVLEGNQNGRKGQYTHDLFTAFALDFIRRHAKHPFFLYVPYTIPHERLEVPSLGIYKTKPWPEKAKTYAAMVSRLDRDVGRILDLLKQLKIERNTVVFFTSDNGAAQKPWGDLFHSRDGFQGRKGELFEGGIRVPMVVRWPGMVPVGKVSDVVWYFADVLPTLASLAGTACSACDGMDVSSVLFGRTDRLPERFLYWEYPKKGLSQAVRWGNWKALRLPGQKSFELYDLNRDTAEEHDVAAAHPDVLAKIEAYVKTARTESPHWPSRSSDQ